MIDAPMKSDLTADQIAALVVQAKQAASNAHAPYSNYGVGAAVLLKDGSVITGCNFENASYGLTVCAETVALGSVNAAGMLRAVRAIAVIGGLKGADGAITGNDTCHPCGRCRQVINEAADLSDVDIPVYCASGDGTALATYTISELLPHAFGPKDLGLA